LAVLSFCDFGVVLVVKSLVVDYKQWRVTRESFFGGLGNLAYRTAIFVAINGDYSLVNGGFIPAIAIRAPVIYTFLKK
jgi:hypothetical protein